MHRLRFSLWLGLLISANAFCAPLAAQSRMPAKPAVTSAPRPSAPVTDLQPAGTASVRTVATQRPSATDNVPEDASAMIRTAGGIASDADLLVQTDVVPTTAGAIELPPLAPGVESSSLQIISSQTPAAAAEAEEKPEPPKEPEKPKEKAWYEKYKMRGYAQFRINHTTDHEDGTAVAQHAGDSSVGARDSFLIRRARLIFQADITDHLFVYLQPDFASGVPGSTDAIQFAQIRDWYGDLYVDTDKVHRFRVGQSKVPFGWENLQSSSNRVPLDRDDAFNSATRNERDLGVFYYWTPVEAQELFDKLNEEGLKPSGNYGIFGIGVHNGQGGSFREENDNVHLVSRLTWPWEFENGQIIETSVQGYTGEYVVLGSPIRPLGAGAVDVTPLGTRERGQVDGHLDQRIGGTFVWYPQPLGFQAEWLVGRGPELNDAQTAIERDFLQGGYAMLLYRIQTDNCGDFFPFARWQYFDGGYRSFRNAPHAQVKELDAGLEWQIRKEVELTLSYSWTERTNLDAISSSAAVSRKSYRLFDGQLLRLQCQINY
ncbi:MAG: porin [Planctomycetaceae bacterium]|nr:porin [Planctomycetaceae bacterium]